MNTQPEALRLAELLERGPRRSGDIAIAAELRRLFEHAHEQHSEIYGLRLQVRNLTATLKQIRAMCADFGAYTACDVASAAIEKATGEKA